MMRARTMRAEESTSAPLAVLLVDPSSHGGIVAYTALVARALTQAGARARTLGSRALEPRDGEMPLEPDLAVDPWSRPPGSALAFFGRRLGSWIASAIAVMRAVRRHRPDVVHFQMPLNRRLDGALVRLLALWRPVVWTAHDVLPFESTPQDRRRFARIYRGVDALIVHTHPAADEVRALAGVRATVIEHPVAPHAVVPRAEARVRLGLDPDGRLLVALGFIRAYKGYDLLADVWESLGASAPTLLVMGELLAADQRPVVERLRRCPRTVMRLGYASDEDVWLATCAADALLLPYANASDSGVLHLGRAAGVPVIASDRPQLAASVRETSAGAVVARDAAAWSAAVTGALPPPPPAPPPLAEVGARHLAVYREALARRRGARRAMG
ncbi:MAG TPA: glycosyltransferase [Polyangia bacterium]|jgi:glycosyltransferase involved in cell wall biosynthesis|nr:glycosyltransferase [Polyangia bacterium]